MKQIYAFETEGEYEKYRGTIQQFSKVLNEYQKILEREYALVDLPKGIYGHLKNWQLLFFQRYLYQPILIKI